MSKNKIRLDICINFFFSMVRAISLMWIIRVAGATFNQAVLGSFLLARRNSSTGANLLQLGMAQTIKRNVAKNKENDEKKLFVIYALWILFFLGLTSIPLIRLFNNFLSELIYPNTDASSDLVLWTWFLLLALILNFIAVSTYMAERKVVSANIIETMSVSGFLLLALFLLNNASPKPYEILMWQTYGIIIISILFIIFYLNKQNRVKKISVSKKRYIINEFISYGLPRGLITFLDMCLLLIVPWFLRKDPEQAGYILIAFTVVKIIQTVINPISQIVSIVVAKYIGEGKKQLIEKGICLTLGTVIYLSVLIAVGMLPWTDKLVYAWLGSSKTTFGVLNYMNALLIAAIPFSIFQGVKSIIEMIWHKPYNLYTLITGIIVQFISFVFFEKNLGLAMAANISILLSFSVIGVMSIFWIRNYLANLKYFGFKKLIAITIGVGFINYVGASVINNPFVAVVFLSISEATALIMLITIFKTPFISDVYSFIMPKFILEWRN